MVYGSSMLFCAVRHERSVIITAAATAAAATAAVDEFTTGDHQAGKSSSKSATRSAKVNVAIASSVLAAVLIPLQVIAVVWHVRRRRQLLSQEDR